MLIVSVFIDIAAICYGSEYTFAILRDSKSVGS